MGDSDDGLQNVGHIALGHAINEPPVSNVSRLQSFCDWKIEEADITTNRAAELKSQLDAAGLWVVVY